MNDPDKNNQPLQNFAGDGKSARDRFYIAVLTDLLSQMALEKAPALCQMDGQDWPDPRADARWEYKYAHRLKSNYLPPISGGSETTTPGIK